ncbi:hypothetical protein [Streptomyces sp. ODS28]|uniref:hypothetical protein n=1 Tax=Streptomyces sp. ODS28 TaxID=3136688 RepID=UPI0031E6BC9E
MHQHAPAHEPADTASATATHQVTVSERGAFATAQCACGWRAPARRSRDKSRKDAAEHTGSVA